MKTSTPSSPKPPDPLSILLIGPPGGGKTTLSLQFPSVCVLDLDSFLDGPEKTIRTKWNKELTYSYIPISRDDNNIPLAFEKCYDRLVDSLKDLEKNKEIKTVVIDSLTLLDEMIVRKIGFNQKREYMESRDWDIFRSDLLKVLIVRLRTLARTTICLVHERDKEIANPKNIMEKIVVGHKPTIRGSVGQALGGFFTDVWRCHTKVAPGDKLEYFVSPVRTSNSDYLKNSLDMKEAIKGQQGESMFEKLLPYLKGRI